MLHSKTTPRIFELFWKNIHKWLVCKLIFKALLLMKHKIAKKYQKKSQYFKTVLKSCTWIKWTIKSPNLEG